MDFLRDPNRGRPRPVVGTHDEEGEIQSIIEKNKVTEAAVAEQEKRDDDEPSDRTVDVVLSDMSAPWAQTKGFSSNSLSNPYHRMMNTSGISFRDHAGSMVWFQFPFNVQNSSNWT